MTVHFVSRNSYNLAYVFHPVPNRPTILFLPGYYSDMSGTKALFLKHQAADNGYGFLSLDYSGHGQSGGDFLKGTISSWLEDVIAVVEVAQADNLIVVGSSMGGWLMLLLALKKPSLIRRLVGIAAAPDFTEELIWPALSAEQKEILQTHGSLRVPSDYNEVGTPLSYGLIEDGRQNLLLRQPIECTVPIRLIHGTADKDVPYQFALKLMGLLTSTDINVRLLKDADHRLSQPEQLKIIWQEVLE